MSQVEELGGNRVRLTVDVSPPPQPPELNFSVSPQDVPKGGSATLTWVATNADGCTASGRAALMCSPISTTTSAATRHATRWSCADTSSVRRSSSVRRAQDDT